MNSNSRFYRLTIFLLCIYVILLIWIILFKLGVQFSYMQNREVNLIPYKQFLQPNSKIDFGEILLNIILFIPLGMYTRILFYGWSLVKNIFLFLTCSLIMEGLQFIFKIGSFDITDIINNTVGGMIGFLIVRTFEKFFDNRIKAHKFLIISLSVGTILIVIFLILLKTNNLWIRYQ